jgi:hypothetical protein
LAAIQDLKSKEVGAEEEGEEGAEAGELGFFGALRFLEDEDKMLELLEGEA